MIKEKTSYKFANLILSKEEPFTFKEIYEDLKEMGIYETEEAVRLRLKRLRDSGIIIEHGFYYSFAEI